MRPFQPHDTVPEVPASEAHRRVQQQEALLLDVREGVEFAEVRAPDAINIPLGELAARQAELDPDRPIAVICRSGNRSALAVQHLRQLGVDAVNVADGLIGWHSADLPLETDQARVA
ncbi:MAG: rhodanese-like domain-containing protein [Nitriliruptoraceae bacterium]